MNILYISHLTTKKSEGPNNSVPARVKAQSKYDNVFWWNVTEALQDHWVDTGLFHGVKDYPNNAIGKLPKPFNKPDLVVFESFYYLDDVLHSWECRIRKIPYVITARGALTWQGQAQKRVKKMIANRIMFRSMVTHAASIQYLTKQECTDSGIDWNKKYFIIPNGTFQHENLMVGPKKKSNVINGVYIGRFDPYQKGLDLLLKAVEIRKELLRSKSVTISLYGPERMGFRQDYKKRIAEKNLEDILVVKEGVFGEDKVKVLCEANFFIMTSRYEGMPMSMIEAMSYGLPCFVTKGTNLSDEIKKHKAGWECDTSIEGIVNGFDDLARDIDDLAEYGQNSLKLSKKYDWDVIGRRTHDKYREIVSL